MRALPNESGVVGAGVGSVGGEGRMREGKREEALQMDGERNEEKKMQRKKTRIV